MKKLLLLLASLYTITAAAQTPQKINYQAVVRNAQGAILPGTQVSVRFSIHDTSAVGPVVFQETHSLMTNQFGLINTSIGSGNASGISNLANVSWGSGDKYLQTEVDVTGGINYVDMGTTQLMSVPYALFAGNVVNGTTGATGVQGATGPVGAQGATGAAGTNGTNGTNGATGVQGPTGAAGTNGVNGTNGATGIQGPTGAAGTNGVNGTNGATGIQGPTGAAGTNGTNGTNGATGVQGPTGAAGTNGANGTNGATGVQGPTGAAGTNGTNGTNGATGVQGPTGAAGTNGANGTNGATGIQGPTGAAGTNGATGIQGPTGAAGTNGATGIQGPTGAAATNGATGVQGPTGTAGTNGTNGTDGTTGIQGPTGAAGSNGTNGTDGATGSNGATGVGVASIVDNRDGTITITLSTGASTTVPLPVGPTGATGVQGPAGANGTNGTTGVQGPTGAAGPTGPLGAAAGDLSGTYPGPTVAAIRGTPVSATAPSTGSVLQYNGSAWAPADPNGYFWKANGNGGTIAAVNFLGTTDSVPLNIKTYNSQVAYLPAGNTGNIAIGKNLSPAAGSLNISLGNNVTTTTTGNGNNIGIGAAALSANSSGGYNVAIGAQSLHQNSSGSNNVAIGRSALATSTGSSDNIAIGTSTLGNSNLSFANVAIGTGALGNLLNGGNNTAVGYGAGGANFGSNNVFLGYNAGFFESGSNKLYINNNNVTSPLIYGDFTNKLVTINDSLRAKYLQMTNGAAAGRVLQSDASGNGSWVTAANIYTGDGTLPANRTVTMGSHSLNFTGGNVGIGNSSPTNPLDVAGDIHSTTNVRAEGSLEANGVNFLINSSAHTTVMSNDGNVAYIYPLGTGNTNNTVSVGQPGQDVSLRVTGTAAIANWYEQILSTPGYARVGSLYIQWGIVPYFSYNQYNVPYPVDFPHAVFSVTATVNDRGSGGASGANVPVKVMSVDSHSFNIAGQSVFSGDASSAIMWMAIGY